VYTGTNREEATMVITIEPSSQPAASRIALRLMMNGIDFEIKGNTIEACGVFDKIQHAVGLDGTMVDMVDFALHDGTIQR
jgi:hypothetical protein